MKPSKFLYSILVSGFVSLGLMGCEHKDAPPSNPVFKGEIYRVSLQTLNDVKPVAATVTTRQMGEATARVSGILTSLKVREGDMVTQGQVIGFVQDQRLNLQTNAYDQGAKAAQAQADLARAALKRTQSLFDKGYYSQARLDQDKAAASAADANTLAARAQALASGEGARQGAILAPASGRVIHASVPVGSVVMTGQSVCTITAGTRVVRIELPEGQSSAMRVGQSLSLEANGIKTTGTISEIYPSVIAGQIVADVLAQGLDTLVIGQKVVAYIGIGQRKAVVVNKRFVTTRYGLDYIRVVQKNGTLIETIVLTTPTGDPEQIEIRGGLNSGDTVAAYGVGR